MSRRAARAVALYVEPTGSIRHPDLRGTRDTRMHDGGQLPKSGSGEFIRDFGSVLANASTGCSIE